MPRDKFSMEDSITNETGNISPHSFEELIAAFHSIEVETLGIDDAGENLSHIFLHLGTVISSFADSHITNIESGNFNCEEFLKDGRYLLTRLSLVNDIVQRINMGVSRAYKYNSLTKTDSYNSLISAIEKCIHLFESYIDRMLGRKEIKSVFVRHREIENKDMPTPPEQQSEIISSDSDIPGPNTITPRMKLFSHYRDNLSNKEECAKLIDSIKNQFNSLLFIRNTDHTGEGSLIAKTYGSEIVKNLSKQIEYIITDIANFWDSVKQSSDKPASNIDRSLLEHLNILFDSLRQLNDMWAGFGLPKDIMLQQADFYEFSVKLDSLIPSIVDLSKYHPNLKQLVKAKLIEQLENEVKRFRLLNSSMGGDD